MNFPSELKYTKDHEWIKLIDDKTALIGITDFAQRELGDIVFVELPAVGTQVRGGEECAVVESVKAASDIYSPLSGQIVEVNDNLAVSPGLVNEDPYGSGWIFRLKLKDPAEYNNLLDAPSYEQQIASEVH